MLEHKIGETVAKIALLFGSLNIMQITLNIPDNLPADIVAQYIESIEKQIALLAKGFNQTKPADTQKTTQTEGEKALQLLEKYQLLGCMEGDGHLSENYKQHLWK